MDPFDELSVQCRISASQEEILHSRLIPSPSQGDLRIFSGQNEPHPGHISATSTGNLFCSAHCRHDEEASLLEKSPKDALDGANSDIFEPSKRKPAAGYDLGFDESTAKKSRALDRESPSQRNLGFSNSKGNLFGGSTARDPSSIQRCTVPASPGIDRGRDLGLSKTNLKESGVSKGKLLSEKELGFFERMKFLISMGAFPDLGFLNSKGEDSSVSPRIANLCRTSDASTNLVGEICRSDGPDIGFSERVSERPRISKEKSPTNLGLSNPKGDSSDKFTAKGPANVQTNAGSGSPRIDNVCNAEESRVLKGNSQVEMKSPGLSKSKAELSAEDTENFQKSPGLVALPSMVNMKDANASHDLTRVVLGDQRSPSSKRDASISKKKKKKKKSKNPENPKSPGELLPAKSPLQKPIDGIPPLKPEAAHKGVGCGRRRKNDVGNEFASFIYSKAEAGAGAGGRPRRKLPHWIEGQGTTSGAKKGIGGGDASSQAEIVKNLVDAMKALSKESDKKSSGDEEDILEVAMRAGYTFPRPRWWQPGWD